MRRTIYATTTALAAIGSVMSITVPAAQADEVCFSELSNRSIAPALVETSVTSPQPGKLRVTAKTDRYGEAGAFTSVVIQLHEGSSYYFKEEIETGTNVELSFNVPPGPWSVTGFARRDVSYPTFGIAYSCHSPIQYLGSATVAVTPLHAAKLRRNG